MLALAVSTGFAAKNFILFAKALRTLLASRSNPLRGFASTYLPNKKDHKTWSFLLVEMAGVEPASKMSENKSLRV